jgi:hypothetical protein
MRYKSVNIFALLIPGIFFFLSCRRPAKEQNKPDFPYKAFKDSLQGENYLIHPDSSNLFDKGTFIPSIDSLQELLVSIDTMFSRLKRQQQLTPAEKVAITENISMLDSFYFRKDSLSSTGCHEKECGLYVHVIKSRQVLYLYLGGELKDSFPVSTGMKKYATPEMSLHPRGPLFMKYTSRKFPGGNYKGLGNMPYAVFVKGGYAIHGTTPGNFSKLGQVASHGCIRLHPDNGRLFYELVKLYGLSNTWVKVTDQE